MRLIDIFTEKVLQNTGDFEIHMNDYFSETELQENFLYHHYIFLQRTVGKGRFVYGVRVINQTYPVLSPDMKFELIAVVSDNKVFVYNERFLDFWKQMQGDYQNELPENTYIFTDVWRYMEKQVAEEIFPSFYDSLEEDVIDKPYILHSCRLEARKYLFLKNPDIRNPQHGEFLSKMFTMHDVAGFLCGVFDLKEEALRRLHITKTIEFWKYRKAWLNKIKEYTEMESTAEEWERNLAKAFNDANAKNVTVEFLTQGKSIKKKLEPASIIRALIHEEYFWFASYKTYCSDIKRITYGRKVLYERP